MTTPGTYAEHVARQRHLRGDKGPLWQARQRAEHRTRPPDAATFVALILGAAIVFLVTCVLATGAKSGEPAVIEWSTVVEDHLWETANLIGEIPYSPESEEIGFWAKLHCERQGRVSAALCAQRHLQELGYPSEAMETVWGWERGKEGVWLAVSTTNGTYYVEKRRVAHETRMRLILDLRHNYVIMQDKTR